PLDARVYWFVGIGGIIGLLAFFPGNLAVSLPHTVKVDPGIGITLYGPFRAVFIPLTEILDVEKSSFTPGYVIIFSNAHGLIQRCIIPRLFGAEREELVRAIRLEVEH
ncbi:MAG: hypothetical protein ACREBW_01355, partial [Candidatus Micrarchaeaceae archaeon]